MSGGLQGVANAYGVQTPEWSKRLGETLTSPAANTALGMVGGKGPYFEKLTAELGKKTVSEINKIATERLGYPIAKSKTKSEMIKMLADREAFNARQDARDASFGNAKPWSFSE
jgi:hypothetical protein